MIMMMPPPSLLGTLPQQSNIIGMPPMTLEFYTFSDGERIYSHNQSI